MIYVMSVWLEPVLFSVSLVTTSINPHICASSGACVEMTLHEN